MTPDQELALRIAEELAAAGKLPQEKVEDLKNAMAGGTLTEANWISWLIPMFPAPAPAAGNGN